VHGKGRASSLSRQLWRGIGWELKSELKTFDELIIYIQLIEEDMWYIKLLMLGYHNFTQSVNFCSTEQIFIECWNVGLPFIINLMENFQNKLIVLKKTSKFQCETNGFRVFVIGDVPSSKCRWTNQTDSEQLLLNNLLWIWSPIIMSKRHAYLVYLKCFLLKCVTDYRFKYNWQW